MFSDPESNIPAKCSLCKTELFQLTVEIQLNQDQLDVYMMYLAQSKAAEGERIMHCPFCKYFEIWTKENSLNFFYCKKKECKKASCSICFNTFKTPKNEKFYTGSEVEELKSSHGMLSHLKCYEYKDLKKEWDEAIENGNKVFCPECGHGGINNSFCTHIACAKCNTQYCYICGLPESKLNKSKAGNIFRHNDDWNTNKKRCP
mmetsp:Transcript_39686/g.45569  ORF Transcript_39686/g.45569 Transcript_39686/m.45569 type:complete len:203 (-) Transcript_39686:235-843(-)